MSASTARPLLAASAILALMAASASRESLAVTVSVGNGGCQYIGLQFALDELESQPGPHTIKLKSQTIAIPNGIVLDTANTSYTFIGGHANCSDAQPTAGQRTVLDATGGNDGTAIAVNGSSSTETPFITLSRVTVRGATSETGDFANPEGGGLEIRGRASVILTDLTQIQNNTSGRGGGVYLRGDNASELASLTIVGDSWIIANTATRTGGGIYCDQHGRISLNNGQISFNEAQGVGESGLGGGARLRDTCRFSATAEPGSRTGFFHNDSASSGAGMFVVSDAGLNLRGALDAPFWFEGNRAGSDGGGLVYDYSGTTTVSARLENVVFLDNFASNRLGAAFNIRGAVNAYFGVRTGATSCGFAGVSHGGCAAVVGSRVGGIGNYAGTVHLDGSPGRVPRLEIRRAVFDDNQGQNLFSAWGPGVFNIEGVVVTRTRLVNQALDSYRDALMYVEYDAFDPVPPTGLEQRFAFSTVVDSSSVAPVPVLFNLGELDIDVTGSILHAPSFGFRHPQSTGGVTHNGCLLVASAAGVPAIPAAPIVGSPGLATDLTPTASSLVLDQCDSGLAPLADIRGSARAVDQPAIANRFGPVDLGAIERALDPPPAAPNLVVSRSSITIPDGSTTPFVAGITDFGNINVGSGMLHLYAVRNTGTEPLQFSAHNVSGACSENFTVAALPGNLAAGVSGILGIRFDPIEAGECIVTYQIFSNDPDNSPYDFQLRGVGIGSDVFSDGFE
jgi:hypothetical protein